jgi:hypothetical protein
VYVSHMSARRLTRGAALCWLGLGCGERSGDPVIALHPSPPRIDGSDAGAGGTPSEPEPNSDASAGAAAGTGATSGVGGSGGSSTIPETGPVGLCGPCASSNECGDANDACILHDDERFCGRDCDDQNGCPDGYACVALTNSPLWQCVPQEGCVMPAAPAPTLAEVRQYVLARINTERALHDRSPLQPSDCLDELAQDSALDFARTDEPLGKYVKECDPIWPFCACDWSAEAEIAIARYGLDWTTAIEESFTPYRDTERFTQSFLAYNVTDVGVGFWISGDEAWIALSFR